MPITTAPFVLKNVSLTLVKSGGATPVEYKCQLTQAQLTPAAGSGGGLTLETFCDVHSEPGSGSTWTLDLSGFQAYADATDFSVLSFQEEGEKFDFVLMPIEGVVSATNPAFEGEVTMVATPIGGTAATHAVFTASLPCSSKPAMVTVPALAARQTAKV